MRFTLLFARLRAALLAGYALTVTTASVEAGVTPTSRPAQPTAGKKVSPSPLLVSDGRPRAVIVLADEPSSAAAQGATVLAAHLSQMSGTLVPQVKASALSGVTVQNGVLNISPGPVGTLRRETLILVGQSPLTEQLGYTTQGLGPGGIRIHTGANYVVLLGTDDLTPSDTGGTGYAVTTFLEALGVRYLWPGESGKVVPRRATIVAPVLDQTYSPKILQRRIRNQAYGSRLQTGLDMLGEPKEDYIRLRSEAESTVAKSPDWFAWQHLGGSLGLATGHSFGDLWIKYGKEHPEWFALQANGSRDQSNSPDRPRLCESNVALQAQIARDRVAELDADPKMGSVSIDENDGGNTTFCMCPVCKQLDPPDGKPITINQIVDGKNVAVPYVSLTDRLVYFWNGIAEGVTKAHPDALLTVRAYSLYESPPVHRKLHPNLVVEQVSGSYLNDEETRVWLAEWKNWSAMAPKISWRPNIYETTRRIGLPAIFVHKMAADFRARAHNSMISTDVDSCFNNWATGGLNLYVLARLHWNPDLDVDATIDDYCQSGFGNGAESVKKYLGRIETITNDMAMATEGSNDTQIKFLTAAYNPQTIDALRADLDSAQAACAGDAHSLRRVRFLRAGLEFTALQARAYRLNAEIKANGGKAVDAAATKAFVAERQAFLHQVFRQDILAVNVPYALWAAEGNLSSLRAYAPRAYAPRASSPGVGKTVIDADERGRPVETPGG